MLGLPRAAVLLGPLLPRRGGLPASSRPPFHPRGSVSLSSSFRTPRARTCSPSRHTWVALTTLHRAPCTPYLFPTHQPAGSRVSAGSCHSPGHTQRPTRPPFQGIMPPTPDTRPGGGGSLPPWRLDNPSENASLQMVPTGPFSPFSLNNRSPKRLSPPPPPKSTPLPLPHRLLVSPSTLF